MIEFVLDLLFTLFIEVLLIGTGEVLRFVFTLGRRKPTLQFWKKSQLGHLPSLMSASALVGFLFWITVLLCLMA
jgi:hypothetical protein